MQTFHNDDAVFLQTQLMSMPFPFSGFEVEAGQLHFFATENSGQILTEELRIQRIDMFKVQLAIRAG